MPVPWKADNRDHRDLQQVASKKETARLMEMKKKEHASGGQMRFRGVLQKVAAQCRVVKTFDSALRASRSKKALVGF